MMQLSRADIMKLTAFLAALLCAGAAMAGEVDRKAYANAIKAKAADIAGPQLAKANAICNKHAKTTWMRLNDDTVKVETHYDPGWEPSCAAVFKQWEDGRYEDRAQKAVDQERREQEQRDLDFVRGVAGTEGAPEPPPQDQR